MTVCPTILAVRFSLTEVSCMKTVIKLDCCLANIMYNFNMMLVLMRNVEEEKLLDLKTIYSI